MTNSGFDTPEAAEAAFYQAFTTVDADLMVAVWADGDDALCIHPGSDLRRGKTAVMTSWTEIFSGSLAPAVEYRYVGGYASENLVVRIVEERIWPRDKQRSEATRVLATNVYVRDEGSWRMTEHHASLPLMERGVDSSDQRRLH